jgi:hypothetical protein
MDLFAATGDICQLKKEIIRATIASAWADWLVSQSKYGVIHARQGEPLACAFLDFDS